MLSKSIRKYIHSISQIKQSKLVKTIKPEAKHLTTYWTKSLEVMYEFHEYLDTKSRSRCLKNLLSINYYIRLLNLKRSDQGIAA